LVPFLSVVIPAYNEEARLTQSLLRVAAYLNERMQAGEIVIVNDGSRDRTLELAQEFAGSYATAHLSVTVLDNPGNRGKGYSVRNGMLRARGEWALFSDADLSSPIEECDRLLARAESARCEVAIGSRALDRSLIGVHQPPLREVAGRLFNGCMRLITGLPYADTQCGFKLFRQDAARRIFARQRLERFGFDVEILFIARKLGYHAVEVPVRWNNAEGTKVGMLSGLDAFLDIWRVRWNDWRGRYERDGVSAGRGLADS
jgi:dolichyl-phosphate beta-glucosyltransferase